MSESTKQSLSHYKRLCARESPYPMNYLPYVNPAMAVLGGMMIEKEMLNWPNFWEKMWYKHCDEMRYSYWAYSNGIRTYETYLWFGGELP